ncbi:MAG: PKD domain-containing protein [Flavisolibacter sp.]
MQRLKSGSIILVSLLVLQAALSQQVINNVTIEKKRGNVYQIQYSLAKTSDFDVEHAVLKIYRRRNGTVEEIFSLPLSSQAISASAPHSLDWTASNGMVQKGDDLQARIILTLNASAERQRMNRIPVADAGSFLQMEVPITKPVELNGTKSHDMDGRIVSVEWKQLSGPTQLTISPKDSLMAYASGEFKPGTYAFELTVKDNLGSVATSRTALTVKATSYWSTDRPADNPTPSKTNNKPIVPQKTQSKLKGGPSNAALDLLLPGLGHYFVSGNYNGENRKPAAFIVSAIYLASIGGAFYLNKHSSDLYDKYNQLAAFREYQKDANGQVIGIRGGNQAEADNYYNQAKSAQRNSLICLGVAGGIMVGDAISTVLKGTKNKKEWESENTAFKLHPFISTDGYQAIAGVQFKF